MEKYRYTKEWFLNSEIKYLLFRYVDATKQNNILEIGCYEGLSSIYFADNFLEHTNSTLMCIDPFLNIQNNDHQIYLQNNEEQHFDFNLSICKNRDKITIQKITSDQFFKNNQQMFNFIYIDGCHEIEFIKRDMENSFRFLEINGIMWLDDYLGGDEFLIKNTMNNFLMKYKGQYEIVHIRYQLAIRRIK